MVFPMQMGQQMRGALTIARDFVQGPQGDEKAAGKFVAHRLAHAIATGLAWRNAHDHARYWRAIFDAIPEIIIIRDANQQVLLYNEGALEAAANAEEIRAARELKQPEPTPVWDTHLPHQKDLPPDEIPSVRAVRDQTQILGAQLELTTHPENAEPQIIPVLATAVPLFDSTHQLMRSVTIVHDMTATKRVEQMKDTLATRVRHDVNGPLTSTKIAAQLINRICMQLQAEGVPASPQQLQAIASYAQGIEQGCVTIGGITAALDDMEFAISSTPIRMSLVEFVRNHLHSFRVRYPERQFICDVLSSVDTLLEGYWCKDHVEIILNNLLENAIKYSPAGTPVTIQLKADAYEEQPMAHLIVKDQGYGIDPKDQEAIFEKNVRVTPTDEHGQPIPGTGEGLHYCKIYAMMYGLKPWVRSAGKNKGSEFHVRLPLAQ